MQEGENLLDERSGVLTLIFFSLCRRALSATGERTHARELDELSVQRAFRTMARSEFRLATSKVSPDPARLPGANQYKANRANSLSLSVSRGTTHYFL